MLCAQVMTLRTRNLPSATSPTPQTSEASWGKGGGVGSFQHLEEKKRHKIR